MADEQGRARRGWVRKAQRRAVLTVSALAVASGAVVAAAPPASAGECVWRYCGGVKNRTDRVMVYTTRLSAHNQGSTKTPHRCQVWNTGGGSTSRPELWWCYQVELGRGNAGGYRSGTDVDAFTYRDHGYHVRWSRVGSWSWHIKGVWTKISTDQTADCSVGAQSEIWCTVLSQ